MSRYLFFEKSNSLWLQFLLLGVIAVIFIFFRGLIGFWSILMGGVAWIVPNLYFIWRAHKTLYDSQKMLSYFLLSELIKLTLSFVMIGLILSICAVDRVSFLVGYAAMIVTSFLIFFKRGVKNGISFTSN